MKGNVYLLENNADFTNKINGTLGALLSPGNVVTNLPSSMGSEDFAHLVLGNNRIVNDYIKVGIVNSSVFGKAIKEGKRSPYF